MSAFEINHLFIEITFPANKDKYRLLDCSFNRWFKYVFVINEISFL